MAGWDKQEINRVQNKGKLWLWCMDFARAFGPVLVVGGGMGNTDQIFRTVMDKQLVSLI